MARIGDTPNASRYDGLATGPHFVYTFETQQGVPVDGGNSLFRDTSPFTLRLLPPDVLLSMAESVALGEQGVSPAAVDLIGVAAQVSNNNDRQRTLETALSRTSLVDTSTARLQSAVTDGRFLSDQNSEFLSTLADASTVADIALQLQRITSVPPLTLLINPSEMSISYTKVQSFQTRTREGYVFEAWGEEQPKISFSGSTGGFYVGAQNPTISAASGLQYAAKRDSAAWQNFMSLFMFYKNNGYIYDTIGRSYANLFVGALAIDYDQWTYVGHIESFSYSYAEEQPHRVEFSFEFTVSRMYDRATAMGAVLPQSSPTVSASDPRYTAGRSGARSARGQFAMGRGISRSMIEDVAELPLDLVGLDFGNFGGE